VMHDIDQRLTELAMTSNMRFTRYADDIVFSCIDKRSGSSVRLVRNQILKVLNEAGFRPNLRKTVIRGPGDRKVVLGMLVDGNRPRLAKEFKDQLRMHLHYLSHQNFGPAHHAVARGTSIASIYHHVLGLIFWARAVERAYGSSLLKEFNRIEWPPITRRDYSATVKQASG
jgi:RNA-directed DNA polymerase